MWFLLRNRQLNGWKFRRQVPIAGYIADFLCIEAKLIIEVDGGQHAENHEEDERRTAKLIDEGYKVIRFWNTDVLNNLDGVYETIARALPNRKDDRGPLPRGEGLGEGQAMRAGGRDVT